ncbi:hypothetical protein DY000_02015872 [Brassica cretica]|uniref:Uncharacterized protein n=1 Tax=Brassica cretica TaxID=69181 RepID=A0ABQ7D1H5_BRACR|nr:hypothetical protein DY000_02015872 [Brassica cretica]
MRGHGFETYFPVIVAADLSGIDVWRTWRLSDGFNASSDAVERACGFTSGRWHMSPMCVASPSQVRLGRKSWVWAPPARALTGDGWCWCFNEGGFQRSAFGVCSLGLLRSVGSGVAPSASCVNRGCDLALATLLHLWEMILEATIA